MANDPFKERRDPTRHKWHLWEEGRHFREERRAHRADRNIRVIGGVVLLAIVAVALLAGVGFLIKLLPRMF
jgi:N-acyl-L-homoserine lactone synthetase